MARCGVRQTWCARRPAARPRCCRSGQMAALEPSYFIASTARGYLEVDLWCVMTPSYIHARRTWCVQASLILTGICLERPSWAGGKMTISTNTNIQRKRGLGRAWAVAQGRGAQRAG
eukprot:6204443-Pleurochrysis_carterae.AAC.1